jgi:hypothetical protein
MTTTTARSEHGFFNPDPAWLPAAELQVPRDDKERPLIVPPCATCDDTSVVLVDEATGDTRDCTDCPRVAVPYERISRVVDAADTMRWLLDWRLGMLARGLAQSRELAMSAAGLAWNDPRMAAIIEAAHDRAGGNDAAAWGTALHIQTEPGRDPAVVPEEMRPDVLSYRLAHEQAGVAIIASEVFVVNDELRIAGTLDTIIEVDGHGRMIEDKKSGKFSAKNCAVQLGCYSRGSRVDMDLIAAGRFSPRRPLDVSTDIGIVAHVPREGGTTTLKQVDIARGWERAKIAMAGKALDDMADWCLPEPLGKVTRKDTIAAMIDAATSHPELRDIMDHSERYLTKALRERANQKWLALRTAARG